MQLPRPGIPLSQAFPWLLAGILLFSLVSKTVRLGTPSDFYFDEVYHGFTATRYLHNDLNAYDPWAKSPPGKAFEWTHPPLAKLLMAGVMVIAGENPVGWRLGSVIFSTASLVLIALLALELFGSHLIALMAALLMALDGLLLAQGRIAMNDSYFIFFMLLTVWQYLRWRRDPSRLKPLIWTGIGIGLMAATKWTTLYVVALLGADLLYRWNFRREYRKDKYLYWIPVILIGIPAAIYILSYAQLFLGGKGWEDFETIQKQMWWYHSRLAATHGYQSIPIQWILNLRPVWMYLIPSDVGTTANIYNLGNSIVLIGGLLAVVHSILLEKRWDYPLYFTTLLYFILWFPWNFSPRIMFFYHYAPAIPFLCLLFARFLAPRPKLARATILAAAVWFVVFYPHNTGIAMPKEFAEWVYFRIPGWR